MDFFIDEVMQNPGFGLRPEIKKTLRANAMDFHFQAGRQKKTPGTLVGVTIPGKPRPKKTWFFFCGKAKRMLEALEQKRTRAAARGFQKFSISA